jgi:hypothetical protein
MNMISLTACYWPKLSPSLALRPTISRPVCLGIKHHLGLTIRLLLVSVRCGFVDVGPSLWREDASVVQNCCWSSPAQSFTGPSPVGLTTIFYCLRFETQKTKSHCDWRSVSQSVSRWVSQSVLVLSTIWDLWLDMYYCLIVKALILWCALSDERTGLPFVRVIVCSSKSFVITERIFTFYMLNMIMNQLNI